MPAVPHVVEVRGSYTRFTVTAKELKVMTKPMRGQQGRERWLQKSSINWENH